MTKPVQQSGRGLLEVHPVVGWRSFWGPLNVFKAELGSLDLRKVKASLFVIKLRRFVGGSEVGSYRCSCYEGCEGTTTWTVDVITRLWFLCLNAWRVVCCAVRSVTWCVVWCVVLSVVMWCVVCCVFLSVMWSLACCIVRLSCAVLSFLSCDVWRVVFSVLSYVWRVVLSVL
jgi:hypothetical protein